MMLHFWSLKLVSNSSVEEPLCIRHFDKCLRYDNNAEQISVLKKAIAGWALDYAQLERKYGERPVREIDCKRVCLNSSKFKASGTVAGRHSKAFSDLF